MIEARSLTKWFGPKAAVTDVSFSVQKGEVLGFLGPNGAGKSTTMRMITGFIAPSDGTAVIGGHDITDDGIRARALLGYLPENAPLYSEMTVTSFLRFAAELRGLWGSAREVAVGRVIETCFLQSVRHQTIDTLSKGYRHRTCLAQSLLHDPPVLVLDEPTDGLDPNQKHEVRNLIKIMGETKAIILSTHILEEVDAVCSRVIIIDRGCLVANGTPAELRAQSASAGCVTVRLAGVSAAVGLPALQKLPGASEVLVLAENAGQASFRVKPGRKTSAGGVLARAVADLCQARQWKLDELRVDDGRLDEFFRAITVPDTVQEANV